MMQVTIYDVSTGLVLSNATLPDGTTVDDLRLAPDHGTIMGHYGRDEVWIDAGVPVSYPPRPSRYANLNRTTKQWIDSRTLEQVQTMTWNNMKALRFQKESEGFAWDGSVFDSDQVSQSRIMGAVQLAEMNPAFEIPWTLEDNTVRVLSASDMKAVGAALGAHVATIFARAQEIRTEIYAASTIAEVEAITWGT